MAETKVASAGMSDRSNHSKVDVTEKEGEVRKVGGQRWAPVCGLQGKEVSV